MGYVGNQTTTAFTSMDKQDITGDGTPNYTLSHAVANSNEIEVFVNNVRQEPTVAYSASGTTLTMTGNVASTDDFYVVYQGKAVGTIVPPDGSVTSAKIADDAVTSAKLDTNIAVAGDLTVDTDTLHVDSTNNSVGVGTTTPTTLLHLSSTDPRITLTDTDTGADHRINASSSAGNLAFDVDVNSETTSPSAVFNIKGSEAMRIKGGGSGVWFGYSGTVNPSAATSGNYATVDNIFPFQATNNNICAIFNRNSSTGVMLEFKYNGSVKGYISTNGSSVTYSTTSDHRLKENVTAITSATDRLKQLNPVRFNFIEDPDTTVDGFLAHEVQSVVPEAVTGTHNEVDDDGNAVMQGIDQSKIVPLLVATIREQQTAIEALTARVTALEAN